MKNLRNRVKQFVQKKGMKVILYRSILTILPTHIAKKITFKLNVGGGSYTDGERIVVGIPEYFWGMSYQEIFSATKALSGHETEHVLSSDFDIFVGFQGRIAEDFDYFVTNGVLPNSNNGYSQTILTNGSGKTPLTNLSQFNVKERYGMKLGQHLLNSTEDGRIEKRHGNRRQGYVKHIKFLNAVIWENQAVTGDNELQEFLFCITSLCVTGLKSKDWGKVYGGTEQDQLLDEIKPLIIRAINEPTAKGCADRTYEIFQIIAPKVAEMVNDDLDAMDNMTTEFDFSGTIAPEDGEMGSGTAQMTISTHFKPESENESDEKSKQSGGSDDENQESNETDSSEGESSEGETSEGGSSSSDSDGDEQESEDGQSGSQGDEDEDSQEGDQAKESSDDSEEDGEDGKPSSSDTDEEDEEAAKQRSEEEDSLVEDFMNGAKDDILDDVQEDLDNIEQEEQRIKAEEERKKKESGDLEHHDIQSVISGTRSAGFEQDEMDLEMLKPTPTEIASQGKMLRKKLEKILLNQSTHDRKHQRRGYLDRNNLYKVGMKNYEVFEKRGNPKKSTYAVSVLVDRSGSMTERVTPAKNKMECAMEACAVIEEGIKGLVPLRINLFDDFGSTRHLKVLDFGDKESKVNHSSNFNNITGYGNADSISIRIATKELLKRKENKKLLIVLSDGLPSMYHDANDAISSVQNAVRDARKQGVQVIAICFGSQDHLEETEESYRMMYQKGIIMTAPENIPEHLAKVMEREIK